MSYSGSKCYFGYVSKQAATAVDFPLRLAERRKHRSLTQQQLPDRIGTHVVRLRRYAAGTSPPTLGVIGKLSTPTKVSAYMLLFGKDERGPDDEFEAVSRFDPEENQVVRSVLEGMILKHQARRLQSVAANSGERR